MQEFWKTHLRPLLESVGAARIVEVGVGDGGNTRHLLEYASQRSGRIDAIDPEPVCDIAEWQSPYLAFHKDLSLHVLANIGDYDAVLIDGDHNWYTVYHELVLIEQHAEKTGRFPLVFVHDVGWPYGRRDLYYHPETIPPSYRQPYEQKGLSPDATDSPGEATVNAGMHHAMREHGIRNGVLTAVEDFLAQSKEEWRCTAIPGWHGLAILASRRLLDTYPACAQLLEKMTPHSPVSDLVEHLESARMRQVNELGMQRAQLAQMRQEQIGKDAQREHAQKDVAALRGELERMRRTRSWRYTAWVRTAEEGMRRSIRLLGRIFPARDAAPLPTALSPVVAGAPTVAVVIPCHNYGSFLAEALESVLHQTVRPQEIIVIDDASGDDTRVVAEQYGKYGVRYVRGEWLSVGAARNVGLQHTTADFLVFLDADDMLHPTYIQACLDAFTGNPQAGIAYTDQRYFGDQKFLYAAPDVFDWRRFDATNHCHCASMVRRTALIQAGSFSHGIGQDGDWVTWRRILRLGWTAVKADTVLYYRSHERSMTQDLRQQRSYAERAGFFEEPATLCLSLSGRTWAWEKTARFLEQQTFPHRLLHLIILDTSQDAFFAAEVRQWLDHCDYAGVTYLKESVGPKGIADLPRVDAVEDQLREACARMYNRFARIATTTIVFFLEDDILPPADAYVRLVSQFTERSVSVSALYLHRMSVNPVAWEWTGPNQSPVFAQIKSGVTPVGGNGFGCLAVRGEYIRHHVFHTGLPHRNYDHNFYHQMIIREGLTALIDWDCRCEHRSPPTA